MVQVELFIPPVPQKGQYRFLLWLISDSYMGCDSRSVIEVCIRPMSGFFSALPLRNSSLCHNCLASLTLARAVHEDQDIMTSCCL